MEDKNTNINPAQEGQNMPISPTMPMPGSELSTPPAEEPKAPELVTPTAPGSMAPENEVPAGSYFSNPAETTKEPVKVSVNPAPLVTEPEKNEIPATKTPKESFLKKNNKTLKIVAIVVAILVVIGGAALAYFLIFKKISVTISVNQSPADVYVGDQLYASINSPYILNLAKGTYEITASKEGFLSSSQTLNIESATEKYSLIFNLKPQPVPSRIIDKEAFFPTIDTSAGTIFYFEAEDMGYALNEFDITNQNGANVMAPIAQITKVAWSPSFRQMAVKVVNSAENTSSALPYLAKYPEGSRVNWIVNTERKDLVNIEVKDFDPAIKNISFNPDGNKIVYFFQRGEDRYLSMANIDGSNFEPVAQIQTIDFEPDVVWSPEGGKIAYFANTENGAQSKANDTNVFVYDLVARQKIDVSRDGVSTGALFSPDGSHVIYESAGNLHVFNLNETDIKKADLSLEISGSVSTCAWMGNQSIVAYDSKSGTILKTGIGGEKTDIGYRKESIPSGIKNVFVDGNNIYLFTTSGVYLLETEQSL